MANENEMSVSEVSAEPQIEREKLSLEGIRERLVGVNNPAVPVEIRQRALVSLCVEFLDRMSEMRDALGKRVKLLTEQGEKLDAQDQECMAVLQSFLAKSESARSEVSVETGNGNGAPKKAPKVKVNVETAPVQVAPPPPPLPSDAAATAAQLNQVAGLPSMPVVGASVIKS